MILKRRIKWYVKSFLLNFKKKKYNAKVFCIGYNKTGTTTLGKSLELLGYDHSSFNPILWEKYKNEGIKKVIEYTAKFESFDDLPWLKEEVIPIMDEKFPNSQFIYLERDENDWKQSIQNWASIKNDKSPDIDKAFSLYQKHRSFVLDYFKNRENDLLILNIKDENGFKKLANFLGVNTDQCSFPHFNKTSEFKLKKEKFQHSK